MISHHDLILNPEQYEPLGSYKSVRNKACSASAVAIDIVAVFLSESNRQLLTRSLYSIQRQNGGSSTLPQLRMVVKELASDFAKKNNLYRYETVDVEATGIVDWVEVLRAVNGDFIRHCYRYMRWNAFVPFREWIETGPADDRRQKRMTDLMADDIPTLDLWRVQETQRSNQMFRYNNKIPIWQTAMHTRNYDTDNEGLRNDTADRASLEAPIYGYDMQPITSQIDRWKHKEWHGMY